MDKYTDFRYEILKCWKGEVNNVTVVPIAVGALGVVTNKLRLYLDKINFKPGIEPLQKTYLLSTARILRKVLDC